MNRLFTFLVLLSFSSSYAQTCNKDGTIVRKLDCEKFRNGTFRIPADSLSPESILFRNGDVQTETMDKVEGYSEFIVKWYDNCTYTLTPTEKTFIRHPGLPKNAVLTIQIIEI